METRRPPEYILAVSVDRHTARDVVKGVLHTIFFHRFFTPLYPATHDVLDLTLPYVSDDEIERLVDQRATALARYFEGGGNGAAGGSSGGHNSDSPGQLQGTHGTHASTASSPSTKGSRGHGRLVVQFLEKKRRKGWFGGKADEELPWENWIVDVSWLTARDDREAERNRAAVEKDLHEAVMQIIGTVNRERNHIPPITTNETNPFPYQILVNPKTDGWSHKMGIF